MAKPRADKVEIEKRIFQVMGWIVDGVQSALIVKQIVAAGWCDERQARRMLTTARDRWTEGPEIEQKEKRRLKIAELQQLKRTLKTDYKGTPAAIRAIMEVEKQIIMLEGLNAPIKVEQAGDFVIKVGYGKKNIGD